MSMTNPTDATGLAVDRYDDVIDELKRLYGDDFKLLAGKHHARYLPDDVPFHIISRVFQGRHLLRPERALNRIVLGVLGRAQTVFPNIRLFANAFLSNHLHLMLQGPARDVAGFVGFVKREISRRWGQHPGIDWPGTMWHGYIATALPTPDSQITCLKYILSQGVKEGLVAKPQFWPGVHAAKHLLAPANLQGDWFDATAYAVARDIEARKRHPRRLPKTRFYKTYQVTLSQISPWKNLSANDYRGKIKELCAEIEQEGRVARGGRPPLGAKAILKIPLNRRSELPVQPWLSGRRRMICWSDGHACETREFVSRHWEFQRAFRAASAAYLQGDRTAEFPHGAFRPPVWPPASATPPPDEGQDAKAA